jgi:hypothetical protein
LRRYYGLDNPAARRGAGEAAVSALARPLDPRPGPSQRRLKLATIRDQTSQRLRLKAQQVEHRRLIDQLVWSWER